MRLLVCGGRDYGYKADPCTNKLIREDDTWIKSKLVISDLNPSVIIQGGAKGGDEIAKVYALEADLEMEEYRANWQLYGKAAGYRRNAEMLKEGKPDKVLAFKGGKGTLMMIGLAEKAGVEVIKYGWEDQ